jgi:uncharacterized protein YecE (DUF72 family)
MILPEPITGVPANRQLDWRLWVEQTAPRRTSEVRIGCSGWQYTHWRGDFYPAELRPREWFAYYATLFDTVEINNTFYRLPDAATFARWREQAPRQFLYAVKASRFLTHMKKLKDPAAPLARFFTSARELGPRLGPVLYQLPPRWPLNLERFEQFLHALTNQNRRLADSSVRRPLRHVVEFREPSWYDERVYTLLQRHRVAMCLHDLQGSASPRALVGPFVYVRFHGVTKYSGRYPDTRLDEWADWLAGCVSNETDVFAYFNNDVGGHAPRDALRLRERLDTKISRH